VEKEPNLHKKETISQQKDQKNIEEILKEFEQRAKKPVYDKNSFIPSRKGLLVNNNNNPMLLEATNTSVSSSIFTSFTSKYSSSSAAVFKASEPSVPARVRQESTKIVRTIGR